MTALQPGDRVDGFILGQRLGQGGMSMTFLARDAGSGATVLLKIPDPNQLGDAATFERFRRELAIGRRLDHPAAPRLVAAREDSQYPYLALEYVAGENLSDRLEAGPLPVAEVEAIARQLAELLAYCHRQGIIHRDLKPANLLCSADGRLHVIDFGIASVEGMPRVTWRGFSGLAGTPEYMAPEKIRGERGTPRVDIYAFGITLYELLAGRPPYRAEHPLSTMYLHLEGTPAPLLQARPDTPPYLAAVVARCMRRRAAERYRDGSELLHDLQNPAGVDMGILERKDPPMGGNRSLHQLSIHPLTLALLAAGAGLLLILVLLLILYQRR